LAEGGDSEGDTESGDEIATGVLAAAVAIGGSRGEGTPLRELQEPKGTR